MNDFKRSQLQTPTTKTMREPTVDNGDSDSSASSKEIRGKPEFLSRASQIFTGLGRGVNGLNAQHVEEGPRNDLQERFLEAKQSNLFDGRGSYYSDASGVDEESISDASTFELPMGADDDGGSCDDTGGIPPNDLETDIDRLQLEIHAPCASIQTQDHHLERALSGVTINSLASHDSSKRESAERQSILGPLPFFGKSIRGLSNRSNNSDDSLNRDAICNGQERRQTWNFAQPIDLGSSREEGTGRRKSAAWAPGGFLSATFKQAIEKEDAEIDEAAAKEQEKSKAAAKLMHKHFQTANNPQSFRELQKKMKEKGAVTGSSVRALLQTTELGSSSSSVQSEDSVELQFDRSAKDKFFLATDSRPASQRTINSQSDSDIQYQQQKLQQRLQSDPLFGEMESRPYIHLPSREPNFQFLVDVILCSTDEGKSSLLTLHGDKYIGKSKLIDGVAEAVQNGSHNSFTILRSERSVNTTMISFYPFRQIVSSALRACNERTRVLGEQYLNEDLDSSNESDFAIVQRLEELKVLDKTDQMMLSRILPDAMLKSHNTHSLLEGRSPMAIKKDTAATLYKLLIPLQPVLLVFDGDGELDASSWDLLEQLILSSHACCPQMIPIMASRKELTIPNTLVDIHINTKLSTVNKTDAEKYIRTLFDPDCVDKEMVVDEQVLDKVNARANGCPLFLERLVLWAQRREILEIDETRNAVSINDFDGRQTDLTDVLPTTLYEDVLGELNRLSHNELDSLKLACCMGMIFTPATYEALDTDGFFDCLRNLMKSHRIFRLNSDGSFKWRHSVVFDAVSSIIITDERHEIHERICEAFSRSTSTACDVQRGGHYIFSNRLDEAWDQYMDAGKQSEKVCDFTHAVQCYNKAKCCRHKRSTLRGKIACSTALGWSLQALERYDEAEKELESSLEWTMSLPKDDRHEEYSLLTALAKVKSFRSKYREAIELYEKALPLVETNAHSAKWLAHHTSSYGEILRKSGELSRAKELHEEALKYREIAANDRSCTTLELAISYTQLGCTHFGLRDYEQASHFHKKALSVRVSKLDFCSALVSESLNYCADSLQALGCGKEALPLAMHAVKIRQALFGDSHPATAHALSVLARAFFSINRPLESIEIMQECIKISDKAFPPNHANLIPNLMLYGKSLRVSGDAINSLAAYKRALFIHMINFSASQNEMQLAELNACIKELESTSVSQFRVTSKMPIPTIESDHMKTHIIMCSDFHRRCDEFALCMAASLSQMGCLSLTGVIAGRQSQHDRPQFARRTLDSIMLSEVPVAFSKSFSPSTSILHTSPYISCDGVEMITEALNQAPSTKSITILVDSCASDIAEVVVKNPTLFAEKVEAVVILGTVQPPRRRSNIEPAATDNSDHDQAMNQIYAGCQEFGVPTVSLSPDVARGFPFPSSVVDELAKSHHMISLSVQRREETQTRRLWEEGTKENRKYIFGNEKPKSDGQHSLWPLVKSINIELLLALLCCVPTYRESHFRWDVHQVNGIDHKYCRHQNAKAGVLKSQSLSDEVAMLIGFALRTSLLNTSC